MKTTLALFTSAVLIVGCGDSEPAMPADAAVKVDAGARDLSSAVGCTKIDAWPNVNPSGRFEPDYGMSGPSTIVVSHQADGSPWNELAIEAWHMGSYPTTVEFAASDNYRTCDTCPLFGEDCDETGCGTYYFAQAGSVTVERADSVVSMGTMKATATNLRLVEWDFQNDVSADDTHCIEIASAAFDVSWTGIDGGTAD
jgi:hypothetical protein